ncbi:MAG: hypothetical protein LBM98_07070 [Oscillospiraceae bacterium]|nr:hypothetical protein [Oscillospiraceae bacterium]
MTAIIYGVGATATNKNSIFWKTLEQTGGKELKIVAFTDSQEKYWGTKVFDLPVVSPLELRSLEYDKIIVASVMSYSVIEEYCVNTLGIPREKIDTSYVSSSTVTRDRFLRDFAKIVYDKNIKGSVAEGGVCEGIFAKKINEHFPDRTLYLFDTFEGFDARDTELEKAKGFSAFDAGHLKLDTATEEAVRKTLPHPEKAIIRKGYFPDSAGTVNDRFVFVNLDFDLYNPTLAGLEFFRPLMVKGGVILVHDFFNPGYSGVKIALDEFCEKHNAAYMPIGDEISVALLI